MARIQIRAPGGIGKFFKNIAMNFNAEKIKPTRLFLISGPSGSGQDSVIEGLCKKRNDIERVITTVTRKKRPGEKHGKPYYFISVKKFQELVREKKFVEWNKVYGDYRGAAHQEIERVLNSKKIGIWKVDYKGVKTIKRKFPSSIAILLKPESLKVLEERLLKRDLTAKTYQARKYYTLEWLKHENYYDFTVINKQGKLSETIKKVNDIIKKSL